MIRSRQRHFKSSGHLPALCLSFLLAMAGALPLLQAEQETGGPPPEYLTIPAAGPDELTPSLPVDTSKFTTWTRS
ncbi:MAG: hypothetical protein KBA71_16265, partial [Opitutaceae bacterium]|nr:hypothetical protein [Opitutaceae bacterium]